MSSFTIRKPDAAGQTVVIIIIKNRSLCLLWVGGKKPEPTSKHTNTGTSTALNKITIWFFLICRCHVCLNDIMCRNLKIYISSWCIITTSLVITWLAPDRCCQQHFELSGWAEAGLLAGYTTTLLLLNLSNTIERLTGEQLSAVLELTCRMCCRGANHLDLSQPQTCLWFLRTALFSWGCGFIPCDFSEPLDY